MFLFEVALCDVPLRKEINAHCATLAGKMDSVAESRQGASSHLSDRKREEEIWKFKTLKDNGPVLCVAQKIDSLPLRSPYPRLLGIDRFFFFFFPARLCFVLSIGSFSNVATASIIP